MAPIKQVRLDDCVAPWDTISELPRATCGKEDVWHQVILESSPYLEEGNMTTFQSALFDPTDVPTEPAVGVMVRGSEALADSEQQSLKLAGLDDMAATEAWTVSGSSRQLAYSTHGIFRFFGKFPPPIARHLIKELTSEGDWVLDPMAGSGTTAVEAMALRRNVVVRDVSPLSTLLARVKTRYVPQADSEAALRRVAERSGEEPSAQLPGPVGLRNAEHWFLPETFASLGSIRAAIEREADTAVRELLLAAFASTVRRVSRATTQQGRLFLDAKKAQLDAWPTFEKRFRIYSEAVTRLKSGRGQCEVLVEQRDVRSASPSHRQYKLAIVHPPYFNNYRYSRVNSLELAWLGYPHKDVRAQEIREGFKVGRPEGVTDYVEDLAAGLLRVREQLDPHGVLALMIGDTILKGRYIRVTRQLLAKLEDLRLGFRLERVALRVPQFTEASWVASQRRTGKEIGVRLNDFVLLLRAAEDRS